MKGFVITGTDLIVIRREKMLFSEYRTNLVTPFIICKPFEKKMVKRFKYFCIGINLNTLMINSIHVRYYLAITQILW